MRVLVTGAGGFIGRHLCSALETLAVETVALGRPDSPAATRVTIFESFPGLPSASEITDCLLRHRPQVIFHMAGTTRAPGPAELYAVNVFYAMRLLEACRRLPYAPRVVIAGSAAEYGPSSTPRQRLHEDDLPRPLSSYGVSKLAQTCEALAASDLPVVVARMFNPIGPGMPASTAAGRFVAELAALPAAGGVIATGSLDAVRDICDVAHTARVLAHLGLEPLTTGRVYNLCCGRGMPLTAVSQTLERVSPKPVLFRPRASEPGKAASDLESSAGPNGGVDIAVGDPGRLAAEGLSIPPPDIESILLRMLAEAGLSRAPTVES